MSSAHDDLRTRVERLAPEARALLLDRLGLVPGDRRASEQLVAWVVPVPGARHDAADLSSFLRERLPEHMVPAAFVFMESLPRLPNGKADLAAMPDPPAPATDHAAFVPPRSAAEKTLAAVWADVLGIDIIGVHDNFFELGGDSILSIQVVARARRAGLHVTPELVFRHQTLGALAAAAKQEASAILHAAPASAPLSPVQAWFFEQEMAAPHHWHQAVWLTPPADFDPARFERALRRLVAHHDALRATFRDDGAGLRQHLSGSTDVALHEIALPADEADVDAALAAAVDELCAATDIAGGGTVLAAVMRGVAGAVERILLALHHLAVDTVSWSILLEDLRALYDADADDDPLPRTTPFLAFCEALKTAAREPAREADAAYWLDLAFDAAPLPRELDGAVDEGTTFEVRASLDAAATAMLVHDVHAAYNTNVEDFLLAALARTLSEWTGSARTLIGLERHGREPLVPRADLSRTVGWLTAYFPVLLEAEIGEAEGDLLRRTKDALRAIPMRGASYGVLRYLGRTDIARPLAARPSPELIFNHAGRLDATATANGPWSLLAPPFASRARTNRRAHRMEVNTFIAGGSLHVHWAAGSAQYSRATVERLASGFLEQLRALGSHALNARTSGYTPADFPDAGLDQTELDRFLEGLGP